MPVRTVARLWPLFLGLSLIGLAVGVQGSLLGVRAALEGFDDGWSDWTSETKVDYRKLPEGHYRFRMRARNIYQSVGEETVFALEILPP